MVGTRAYYINMCMKKLLFATLLFLLVGCKPAVDPEFDRSEKIITTKVYLYDNETEVTLAYKNFVGEDNFDGSIRRGWSGWSREAPYQCEIHSVRPSRIDDTHTTTLGHELLHCLQGSYHQ